MICVDVGYCYVVDAVADIATVIDNDVVIFASARVDVMFVAFSVHVDCCGDAVVHVVCVFACICVVDCGYVVVVVIVDATVVVGCVDVMFVAFSVHVDCCGDAVVHVVVVMLFLFVFVCFCLLLLLSRL